MDRGVWDLSPAISVTWVSKVPSPHSPNPNPGLCWSIKLVPLGLGDLGARAESRCRDGASPAELDSFLRLKRRSYCNLKGTRPPDVPRLGGTQLQLK